MKMVAPITIIIIKCFSLKSNLSIPYLPCANHLLCCVDGLGAARAAVGTSKLGKFTGIGV